jgi:hypothetical protein
VPDFINIARKIWRENNAKNIKNSELVLYYTIAREKAEPGRLQVGHHYYGKPNGYFRLIEQSAQKALEIEKQLYGGDWIIVYPPENNENTKNM